VAAGIRHGTCHRILPDNLNISCVIQHSIPWVLTQDLHDDSMGTCGDLMNSAHKGETFLNWITLGDETWCFLYNSQLMQQLATQKSLTSSKKKPQRDRS
jgi:hypothetical protein